MGLQELNYTHSALFTYGYFKVINSIKKIQTLIKSFRPYIIGFDNDDIDNWIWDNWDELSKILNPFLIQKSILATGLSKFHQDTNSGQGDNNPTPAQFRLQPGVVIQIVQLIFEKGLLKSETDLCEFEYYQENEVVIQKWMGILTKYQNIQNEINSTINLLYCISFYYNSPKMRTLSPQQFETFYHPSTPINLHINNMYCPESYINFSASHRIPWKTIDYMFSDLINLFRNDYWNDFYKVDVSKYDNFIFTKEVKSYGLSDLTSNAPNHIEVDLGIDPTKYVLYPIGVVIDPTGPDCFGFYSHLKSIDCDTCLSKQDCINYKNYFFQNHIDNYDFNKYYIKANEHISQSIRVLLQYVGI